MPTCPAGHQSASNDYCDTCGAPMGPQAVPGPVGPTTPGPDSAGLATPAPGQQPCPNCGTANPSDALFCEACGYDYTTGTMPRAGAEAADLLSIDTPAPAPRPAAAPAPSAPATPRPQAAADSGSAGMTPATTAEAEELAADEGMAPAAGKPAPAHVVQPSADASQGGSGAADVGTPGVTPATLAEQHDVAADEGMPVAAGAEAPAAVRSPAEGSAASGPVEWVAEVWIDPEWYEVQQSSEDMPSPGLPTIVPVRAQSLLVGRTSTSRNIHPDIDCGTDSGVSRRQAQLTHDGQRWFVEDLDSANGTYVGATGSALPETPITGRKELAEDDRVYVGAWTRVVLRKATADERAAYTA